MDPQENDLVSKREWIKEKIQELRTVKGVVYSHGNQNRLNVELSLLEVDVQERYIQTLEKTIKSQARARILSPEQIKNDLTNQEFLTLIQEMERCQKSSRL